MKLEWYHALIILLVIFVVYRYCKYGTIIEGLSDNQSQQGRRVLGKGSTGVTISIDDKNLYTDDKVESIEKARCSITASNSAMLLYAMTKDPRFTKQDIDLNIAVMNNLFPECLKYGKFQVPKKKKPSQVQKSNQ